MIIIEVTRDQCLGWILSYPELADRAFSMDKLKFSETISRYISIVTDSEVLCMIKHEWFSQFCIEFHAYLNPKYWGTEYLTKCQNMLECYYKECGAKTIVCQCPEDCKPAIYGSKKVGFQEIGRIKKAIEWKGKMNDIIILQKELSN